MSWLFWVLPLFGLSIVVVPLVLVIVLTWSNRLSEAGESIAGGTADLECWHCHQPTRADLPTCAHCGQELQ